MTGAAPPVAKLLDLGPGGRPMTDLATNVPYHGDNLDFLRRYLPDASVDLVYLDPPFNSSRDDNVVDLPQMMPP